jgi:branched-subunit amino acid transport protein
VIWVVIFAVGAGSYAFRLGPLLLLEQVSLSERTDRVIRYAGISAITALIATSSRQHATGSAVLPTVLAMAVGLALAARGASMMLLLAGGGATYAGAVVVLHLVGR